jgi:hypothetical protein
MRLAAEEAAMTKQKVRPIIQALADWAVDDALASHDAGYPSRKRLPREHYKRKLAEEAPTSTKPNAKARKRKS